MSVIVETKNVARHPSSFASLAWADGRVARGILSVVRDEGIFPNLFYLSCFYTAIMQAKDLRDGIIITGVEWA